MTNYQYLIGLLASILFIYSGLTMERPTREASPNENKFISCPSPTEALFTSLKAESDFCELMPNNLENPMRDLIKSGVKIIPIDYTMLFCKGTFRYMLKFKQATDPVTFFMEVMVSKQAPEIVLKQKKQNFTIGKYTHSYEIVSKEKELSVLSVFDLALVGKAFRIPINKQ